MNELNSIMTQQIGLSEVRNGSYIVGSISSLGRVSFSENPITHVSANGARAECKRLAQANPGKAFIFVKLAGAEMIPTTSISI